MFCFFPYICGLSFFFFFTFYLFKACINRFLVLTEKQMSPCGNTQIGNDIHFHLEGHIVQTEVLHSLTTGIKSVLMAGRSF